jgi:hypothetical protein
LVANQYRRKTIGKNKAKEFIKFQKENPGPHQFEDLWPDVWQLLNIIL